MFHVHHSILYNVCRLPCHRLVQTLLERYFTTLFEIPPRFILNKHLFFLQSAFCCSIWILRGLRFMKPELQSRLESFLRKYRKCVLLFRKNLKVRFMIFGSGFCIYYKFINIQVSNGAKYIQVVVIVSNLASDQTGNESRISRISVIKNQNLAYFPEILSTGYLQKP